VFNLNIKKWFNIKINSSFVNYIVFNDIPSDILLVTKDIFKNLDIVEKINFLKIYNKMCKHFGITGIVYF